MQYDVPRSGYGDLSPLEAATRRLARVNAAIARHEEHLAARQIPPDLRPAVERPYGPSLAQLRDIPRRLVAEIARLEQASPRDWRL